MSDALREFAALALAVVFGAVVPWLGMRLFVPALVSSGRGRTANYRGKQVFQGLGVVWLMWAAAAIIGGLAVGALKSTVSSGGTGSGSVIPLVAVAGVLALVAFALGLVDDVYGSPTARGFQGHLQALREGRATTGLLKLVGIGLASLIAAWVVASVAPWGLGAPGSPWDAGAVAFTVIAGVAIALTSNLVNLLDLRPGRALKAYLLLGVPACTSPLVLLGALTDGPVTTSVILFEAAALAVFFGGPVLAVWRYDLAEQGMLGDAGANAMGSVAGLLVVSGLSRAMLAAYAVVVLGLNLASERVSFSRVIETTPALRWVDSLGRPPVESQGQVTDAADMARYDAADDHDTEEA